MSISLTSPVAGTNQTGFTSPSFVIIPDVAPDVNGKQWVIESSTGTQTASNNEVGNPFSFVFWRPKVFKALPSGVSITGFSRSIPKNEWVCKTTKAVKVNSLGGTSLAEVVTYIRIPVGAIAASADDLKAMLSMHGGAISQDTTQWFDTIQSGTL